MEPETISGRGGGSYSLTEMAILLNPLCHQKNGDTVVDRMCTGSTIDTGCVADCTLCYISYLWDAATTKLFLWFSFYLSRLQSGILTRGRSFMV
jgi:hypothetical protein